jgi:nitrogenase molybdenum-iron protein alpha/beta subunit
MSDLLAVFGPAESDEELLDGIAAYHPDRVTVLVTDACGDIAGDDCDPTRDRIAELLAKIERRTGATVVGLAGDRSQLNGWRFDRELAPQLPVAA